MRPLIITAIALVLTVPLRGADQWIEVKSPNFTVVSNASERGTRTLVWQLEQVRSALAGIWAWARVDLNKPLCVIAVKDERSMRALAPQYWEVRGGTRPASVWVTGLDQHYLAIRSDLRVADKDTINPHMMAYASYIGLVMGQSLDIDLPLWFSRGFTVLLSNTIVRDDYVLVGAPIPWHLQRLNDHPRIPLAKLVTMTRFSPEFVQADQRHTVEAEAWAFVHFLMFGEERRRAPNLAEFLKLVASGADPQKSFVEALGPAEKLEGPFRTYTARNLFSFSRVNLDLRVERERFPVRQLAPAESAAVRASFLAATWRPAEARALVAEARKEDPNAPGSYAAEGVLLDLEKKDNEARVAFASAVELGTTSAYANYRLAALTWRRDADRDTLVEVEKRLSRAIALNTRYADAYSWLGEIRAELGTGEAIGFVLRAISLEPREVSHRLRAAFVFYRERKLDEATAQARTALTLAITDGQRRRGQELLGWIEKAKAGGN